MRFIGLILALGAIARAAGVGMALTASATVYLVAASVATRARRRWR